MCEYEIESGKEENGCNIMIYYPKLQLIFLDLITLSTNYDCLAFSNLINILYTFKLG